ncbi:thiol:disulfide interchange protein DsbG [Billgrantia endophytica]|uniref:Thiol:disulfide interchange protein n=1 Tax=Billgrantia endophytica TaxID=2033802 RepID=A0A2N7TYA1_9GAMM|nr:thiol:disulfide interchange protein DsbG [Halomonas endophytica]PMR73172.1 thiol:disulfide interchange protein DsbG [Halomonas endophytica]
MCNPSLRLTGSLLCLVASSAIADDQWPAPVGALADQGLEIHGEFEAPGGLTGYAASHQGREMALYLTPDGEHAIVGTMVDAEGNDLSEAALDELVRAPQELAAWERLENSHWIQDGDADAPRVLYTFTDPNCPYCRRFWEQARPWVEAGEVQLRHIMVGILQQNSPAKAAALLGADDPAAALHAHSGSGEDIQPAAQPREVEDQVYRNNQLFDELGLYATPTTLFQHDGRLERVDGMPSEERMLQAMGGSRP